MGEELIDRSEMTERLNDLLEIDRERTALIGVDLLRGHLDPELATLPVPAAMAEQVIAANARLYSLWRGEGLPVIHVTTEGRRHPELNVDMMSNPFWATVAAAGESFTPGMAMKLREHNLQGSPQTEIIPEIAPLEGEHVVVKKRLTGFYATDLDLLLRSLGIDTVVLTGVNTNTCITGTAFDAMHRDYKVVVVSDCVASGHGEDLHRFALSNLARCVGWVLSSDELAAKIGAEGPPG
jgi:nicotinamidase-related amidase